MEGFVRNTMRSSFQVCVLFCVLLLVSPVVTLQQETSLMLNKGGLVTHQVSTVRNIMGLPAIYCV